MGNEGANSSNVSQAPAEMSYETCDRISKNEWEAFVAKKTTPTEVVSIPLYQLWILFYFF